MNLIEAVKSGRRYRKVGLPDWMIMFQDDEGLKFKFDDGSSRPVTGIDLTDNYELEEPVVTITPSQYWQAVQAMGAAGTVYFELARRLGLEEAP